MASSVNSRATLATVATADAAFTMDCMPTLHSSADSDAQPVALPREPCSRICALRADVENEAPTTVTLNAPDCAEFVRTTLDTIVFANDSDIKLDPTFDAAVRTAMAEAPTLVLTLPRIVVDDSHDVVDVAEPPTRAELHVCANTPPTNVTLTPPDTGKFIGANEVTVELRSNVCVPAVVSRTNGDCVTTADAVTDKPRAADLPRTHESDTHVVPAAPVRSTRPPALRETDDMTPTNVTLVEPVAAAFARTKLDTVPASNVVAESRERN